VKYLAVLFALFALAVPAAAQAPAQGLQYANEQLADPALEATAYDLMFDLRCVQCDGQSIGDSDAPIAGAMRHEVRARIMAGESPDAIRAFFISRYGEYISFDPPSRGAGLILWIAPAIMLIAAILISLRLFRAKRR